MTMRMTFEPTVRECTHLKRTDEIIGEIFDRIGTEDFELVSPITGEVIDSDDLSRVRGVLTGLIDWAMNCESWDFTIKNK